MANEYHVIVDANLNVSQQAGITQSPTAQQATAQAQQSKQFGVGGAISAQMLVEQGSRLLNATGNQEMANAMSTTARYTFLTARAISGDITAQVTLAVTLATKAIEEVRKQAQFQNEIDNNLIKSGLMNMEGIKVSKNFFTGRQSYSRL